MNPKELQRIPVVTVIDEAKHLNERQWEALRAALPPRDERVRRSWSEGEGRPMPVACLKSDSCVMPPHIGECATAEQIDAWDREDSR